MKYTAQDLIVALEAKHAKDVFASELTLGPFGSRRMDAWAMKRSWSSYKTLGYEIKVTRSDWTRDEKWDEGRAYCHSMYVVCPWGLIPKEEIPSGVGLLWLTKTGSRLLTRRKAATEQPNDEDMNLVISALLINRFGVHDRGLDEPMVEYWRRWLGRKKENRHLGREVASAIREQYDEMEVKYREMRHKLELVEKHWDLLQELGVGQWSSVDDAKAMARERFFDGVPKRLPRDIDRLILDLNRFKEQVERPAGQPA